MGPREERRNRGRVEVGHRDGIKMNNEIACEAVYLNKYNETSALIDGSVTACPYRKF